MDTSVPPPPPPTAAALQTGISWKQFLHVAAPLAFLVGMLTVVLPPLGLFIALPTSLFWSVSSYRRRNPFPLRTGKGAAMGAMMALLTFIVFLVFSLAAIYFKTAEYRDFVLGRVHEAITRNPDPQAQQTLQWLATPSGLIFATVIAMAMVLAAFLVIGMASGALAVAMGKPRNRP